MCFRWVCCWARSLPVSKLFEDSIRRSPEKTNVRVYAFWIGLPLLLIVGLVIAPHAAIGVDKIVTHGATWTLDAELRPECSSPVVVLMLVHYTRYEIVCSPELIRYLQSQGNAVVPIQYRVTYDFGKPRSFQLITVGSANITWSEWLGGGAGCGGKYFPPCDGSSERQNGSPLYESSWAGTEQQ